MLIKSVLWVLIVVSSAACQRDTESLEALQGQYRYLAADRTASALECKAEAIRNKALDVRDVERLMKLCMDEVHSTDQVIRELGEKIERLREQTGNARQPAPAPVAAPAPPAEGYFEKYVERSGGSETIFEQVDSPTAIAQKQRQGNLGRAASAADRESTPRRKNAFGVEVPTQKELTPIGPNERLWEELRP